MIISKLKQFFDKAKFLFRKRPRLIAGLVIVLALSLPFVVNQVLKQQDIRQKAATAPGITFNFGVPTITVNVGQTFDLGIKMNAGTNDIGSLHYKLNYQTGYLGNASSTLNVSTTLAQYLIPVKQTNTDGLFEVTLVNPSVNQVTGNNIDIMKFESTALKPGTVRITMDDIQATAQTYDTYVPVDNAGSIVAVVTIVDNLNNLTPNPTEPPLTIAPTYWQTPSITLTPSINASPPWDSCSPDSKPLGCTCTSSSQCTSGNCERSQDGTTGKCGQPLLPTASPTPTSEPCTNWFGWFCPPSPTVTVSPTSAPTGTVDNCSLKPRGDANCDGKVDPVDFIIWKNEYTGVRTTITADFDNSKDITPVDFIKWKSGYLDTAVPH